MKRLISISIFFILTGTALWGQESLNGEVSYLTSQHIYVRFASTDGLSDGDTLRVGGSPALVIMSHSSTSCVCEPLGGRNFPVGTAVTGIPGSGKEGNSEPVAAEGAGQEAEGTGAAAGVATGSVNQGTGTGAEGGTSGTGGKVPPENRQEIHGRLAVASYTNFANQYSDGRQRMRYTFSLDASHVGNSKLSLETYATFAHTSTNWDEIKNNIFNGLKIYNLSARYDFSKKTTLLAGRSINPKLSSVGAIDGLQFEQKLGHFTAGLFSGSRPDYTDYSIDPSLFQFGAYLGHEVQGAHGRMQNTLGLIEQRNAGAIDRRFMYFQHSNNLVTNLYFFGSVEADLYQVTNNQPVTVFRLYNTFLSLRYRIIRPLSVSVSYSARNNLIYYESYKSFIDRLLEDKTLQGWRARVNYRPVKGLYLGVSGSYRYRKDDPVPTENLHGYATYTSVPGIGGAVTGTVTWMQSAYLNGMIYGLGYDHDLLSGKLSAGIQYHYVDQTYSKNEVAVAQHVGEASVYWNIWKKLSLSVNYEGTFEKDVIYHRVYLNLSQRF